MAWMRSAIVRRMAAAALVGAAVAPRAADLAPAAAGIGRPPAGWSVPAEDAGRGGGIGYTLLSLPDFRQRDAGLAVGRSDRVALAVPLQCFLTWPCERRPGPDAAPNAGGPARAGATTGIVVRLFSDTPERLPGGEQPRLLPRINVGSPPAPLPAGPGAPLLARL